MAILGNNVKGPSSAGFAAGRMYVAKYTLASASTMSELHGWFSGSGTTVRIVIYADSAGSPGALLAYTNALSLTGADVDLSQTGFSVSLPAGDYWIGWRSAASGTGGANYYDAAAPYKGKTTGAADPPDNPFGTTDTSGTRSLSCWAVVTVTPATTVARFSRMKLGAGLTGTNEGSGVIRTDVVGTTNRITVAADSVDISTAYVGQASITTLGTITTGTWTGTTIAVANGGTGQTTAKAARETGLSAAGYYSSATHGAGTTISITAATHGLRASRGLLVQCQTEADGVVVLPDVAVAANGDVTVTFANSQTANSIRVTVIG